MSGLFSSCYNIMRNRKWRQTFDAFFLFVDKTSKTIFFTNGNKLIHQLLFQPYPHKALEHSMSSNDPYIAVYRIIYAHICIDAYI